MVSLILLSIRLKERQLSVQTNRNSCYLVRLTVTANIKIVLVVAYKECLIDHFLSCHLKHAVFRRLQRDETVMCQFQSAERLTHGTE